MERRVFLTSSGTALTVPFIGCTASLRCPDPDIESPMEYEEFDFSASLEAEDEVRLLTTPDDVEAEERETRQNLAEVDFDTQCAVIVERPLRGDWGSHHILGVERDSDNNSLLRVHACSTDRPDEPNDVQTYLSFGIIVDYTGNTPTDVTLRHHY
ncbi:hypothetical protein [Natronococcus pandeyae]|uniref:hypothetical protein n=1 Tax=Natronococcus pandeyae TaxID=2055836 RepID=UPI0011E81917|nr:hypothetical protein [Natronococcus pandeyae]